MSDNLNDSFANFDLSSLDFSAFGEAVSEAYKEGVKEVESKPVEVSVEANTESLEESIEEADGKSVEVSVEANTEQLEESVEEEDGKSVEVSVEANTKPLKENIEKTTSTDSTVTLNADTKQVEESIENLESKPVEIKAEVEDDSLIFNFNKAKIKEPKLKGNDYSDSAQQSSETELLLSNKILLNELSNARVSFDDKELNLSTAVENKLGLGTEDLIKPLLSELAGIIDNVESSIKEGKDVNASLLSTVLDISRLGADPKSESNAVYAKLFKAIREDAQNRIKNLSVKPFLDENLKRSEFSELDKDSKDHWKRIIADINAHPKDEEYKAQKIKEYNMAIVGNYGPRLQKISHNKSPIIDMDSFFERFNDVSAYINKKTDGFINQEVIPEINRVYSDVLSPENIDNVLRESLSLKDITGVFSPSKFGKIIKPLREDTLNNVKDALQSIIDRDNELSKITGSAVPLEEAGPATDIVEKINTYLKNKGQAEAPKEVEAPKVVEEPKEVEEPKVVEAPKTTKATEAPISKVTDLVTKADLATSDLKVNGKITEAKAVYESVKSMLSDRTNSEGLTDKDTAAVRKALASLAKGIEAQAKKNQDKNKTKNDANVIKAFNDLSDSVNAIKSESELRKEATVDDSFDQNKFNELLSKELNSLQGLAENFTENRSKFTADVLSKTEVSSLSKLINSKTSSLSKVTGVDETQAKQLTETVEESKAIDKAVSALDDLTKTRREAETEYNKTKNTESAEKLYEQLTKASLNLDKAEAYAVNAGNTQESVDKATSSFRKELEGFISTRAKEAVKAYLKENPDQADALKSALGDTSKASTLNASQSIRDIIGKARQGSTIGNNVTAAIKEVENANRVAREQELKTQEQVIRSALETSKNKGQTKQTLANLDKLQENLKEQSKFYGDQGDTLNQSKVEAALSRSSQELSETSSGPQLELQKLNSELEARLKEINETIASNVEKLAATQQALNSFESQASKLPQFNPASTNLYNQAVEKTQRRMADLRDRQRLDYNSVEVSRASSRINEAQTNTEKAQAHRNLANIYKTQASAAASLKEKEDLLTKASYQESQAQRADAAALKEVEVARKQVGDTIKQVLSSITHATNFIKGAISKIIGYVRRGLSLLNRAVNFTINGFRPLLTGARKIISVVGSLSNRVRSLASSLLHSGNAGRQTSTVYRVIGGSLTELNSAISLVQRAFNGLFNNQLLEKALKFDSTISSITLLLGGDSTDNVREFADALQSGFGISAAKTISDLQEITALLKGVGIESKYIAGASEDFYAISQYLAALGMAGGSAEEVMSKLQSGMKGMTQSIDDLGLSVRESDMNAFLKEHNISIKFQGLDETNREIVRLAAISEQFRNNFNIRDFPKLLDQTYFRVSLIKSQVEQLGTMIGKLFEGLIANILPIIMKIIGLLQSAVASIAGALGIDLDAKDAQESLEGYAKSAKGGSKATDELTQSAKEFTGTAGFDKIESLNSGSSEDSGLDLSYLLAGVGDISGMLMDIANDHSWMDDLDAELDKMFKKMKRRFKKFAEDIVGHKLDISFGFDSAKAKGTLKSIGNNIKRWWKSFSDTGLYLGIRIAEDIQLGRFLNDLLLILDALTSIAATIQEALEPAIKDLYDNYLSKYFKQAGDDVHEFAKGMKQLSGVISLIFDGKSSDFEIVNAISKLGKKHPHLAEIADDLFVLRDNWRGFADIFSDSPSNDGMLTNLEEQFPVLTGILDILDSIIDLVGVLWEDYIDPLLKDIGDNLPSVPDALDTVEDSIRDITDLLDNGNFQITIKDAASDVLDIIENKLNVIKGLTKGGIKIVASAVTPKDEKGQVKSEAEGGTSLLSIFTDSNTDFVNNEVLPWFEEMSDRISEFIENNKDEIVELIDILRDFGWEAFQIVVDAIIDGLEWAVDHRSTIKEVLDKVLDVLKWATDHVGLIVTICAAVTAISGLSSVATTLLSIVSFVTDLISLGEKMPGLSKSLKGVDNAVNKLSGKAALNKANPVVEGVAGAYAIGVNAVNMVGSIADWFNPSSWGIEDQIGRAMETALTGALTGIGAAVAGPIGAAVGATIGGQLDNIAEKAGIKEDLVKYFDDLAEWRTEQINENGILGALNAWLPGAQVRKFIDDNLNLSDEEKKSNNDTFAYDLSAERIATALKSAQASGNSYDIVKYSTMQNAMKGMSKEEFSALLTENGISNKDFRGMDKTEMLKAFSDLYEKGVFNITEPFKVIPSKLDTLKAAQTELATAQQAEAKAIADGDAAAYSAAQQSIKVARDNLEAAQANVYSTDNMAVAQARLADAQERGNAEDINYYSAVLAELRKSNETMAVTMPSQVSRAGLTEEQKTALETYTSLVNSGAPSDVASRVRARLKDLKVPGFKRGGSIGAGNLFIANEDGSATELIGNITKRSGTDVANNKMITEAMEVAVYNGFAEAFNQTRGSVNTTDTTNTTVNISGFGLIDKNTLKRLAALLAPHLDANSESFKTV